MDATIKNNQQVDVSVSFETLSGVVIDPQLITNVVWNSSEIDLFEVIQSPDVPLNATIVASGSVGSGAVRVFATYEGFTITGEAIVEVTESGVFTAKFTFGTPVDQA